MTEKNLDSTNPDAYLADPTSYRFILYFCQVSEAVLVSGWSVHSWFRLTTKSQQLLTDSLQDGLSKNLKLLDGLP